MAAKEVISTALATGFVLVSFTQVEAGWGKRKRNHADKNNDGRVSVREYKAEKRSDRRKQAQVDTAREEKADKNDDGVVSRKEAQKARAKSYLKKNSAVDKAWEAKADSNGDGKINAGELRAYRKSVMDSDGDGKIDKSERKSYWLSKKAKVNTKAEEKYDANNDGVISGEEAKEMLRDRLRLINTAGRAKVNTEIEAEYDADGDGIISREEAKAIRDALGSD